MQVKQLVAEGVSLNTLDAYGYTPLHHAALAGDLNTVLMCLPRQSPIGEMSEVGLQAKDFVTALHIAAKDRDPRVAHAIVSYANWMVGCGEMSELERLQFFNARTTDGKTALSIATIAGSNQVVALLCKEGANVDEVDLTDASTPLHWAERTDDSCAFKILLENNADLDILNKAGRQPLSSCDALREMRYSPRHVAARERRGRLAPETRMAATDVRYIMQSPQI